MPLDRRPTANRRRTTSSQHTKTPKTQDIEITRGYVPGYCQALGHEFVGVVDKFGGLRAEADARERGVVVTAAVEPPDDGAPAPATAAAPTAAATRVVAEINCNDGNFSCADAVFARNHAPGRSVLGIIGRAGCCAEFVVVPARNLVAVPPQLSDSEAAFAEPLAAALRIVEQGIVGVPGPGWPLDEAKFPTAAVLRPPPPADEQRDDEQRVAVLGDGKLGLLCAQVLALAAPGRVTIFGRHADKMALVRSGLAARVVVAERDRGGGGGGGGGPASPPSPAPLSLEEQYDVVVEATGSASGILRALALCRPAGTVVLKSTVSAPPPPPPPPAAAEASSSCSGGGVAPSIAPAHVLSWAEVCGVAVVNEIALRGSRCGPMGAAVALLAASADVRRLVRGMVAAEFPLGQGVEAMARAKEKGVLKVALVMGGRGGVDGGAGHVCLDMGGGGSPRVGVGGGAGGAAT